jgi:hypothetical protein
VGFESGQDSSAGGFAILEMNDVVIRDIMHILEVLLECSRIIDSTTKAAKIFLLSILEWTYKRHSTHIQEKVAHIIDTDDERKDCGRMGCIACPFRPNERSRYLKSAALTEPVGFANGRVTQIPRLLA